MEKGARGAEKDYGINLTVKTAAQETSIPQQIAIVEEATREKYDAIVIAPGDSIELIPSLKKAFDAGIKIVNIDNRLDPAFMKKTGMEKVPFISVDNKAGARDAVTALVKGNAGNAQAILIEGIRTAANAEDRKNGAMEGFASQKGIQVVASESANWKIDEAHDLVARLLKKFPGTRYIFCANDMMALGVIRLLGETGRKDISVGGFDALPQALDALKAGTLAITVDQKPAAQGRLGMEYALKLIAGESVPAETLLETMVIASAGK
jgi:ribose transport system substrate-binding protein